MTTKKKNGFTLIELLVVISIIGILSTIASVSLTSSVSKARDAKRASEIFALKTALILYFNEHDTWPVSDPGGRLSALALLVPDFLPVLPTDPLNTGTDDTTKWPSYQSNPLNSRGYYYYSDASVACGSAVYPSTNPILVYHTEANANGNAGLVCPILDQGFDGHTFVIGF
ncbi:MAG: type II secretion system protein [Patescibacteria group bacterium]